MPVKHIITEFETTSGLAARYGFSPDAVWNHPENAELRKKRKDMNVLLPGDVLVIPDFELKESEGATEKRHVFVKNGTPALFKLQLYEDDGRPRANQDYVLIVDKKRYNGTTDAQGALKEYVSPSARQGKIILLPSELAFDLQFGGLNPIEDASGIRQRLNNLGFGDAATEEKLKAALMRFQKQADLPETGEADAATRDCLAKLHDTVCPYPKEKTNEPDV